MKAAAKAAPHSVQVPPNRLVGREAELAESVRLLTCRETRLLTFTGPGGVGKTRLALSVASEAGAAFEQGSCFVDLSALSEAELVAPAIGHALGFRTAPDRPAHETLATQLGEAGLLLVIDNFEHLLDATPVLTALLGACPNVALLVTSRERLRVGWERVFAVEPLPVPSPTAAVGDDHARFASVELFVERARASSPGFELTPATIPPVAQICARLDGLPLALELAASQVAYLAPQDILKRIDARMADLRATMRDKPPRHETMRATIAWSYGTLCEAERIVFRRLAIFSGGCTLEAAEAVVAPADAGLDLIDALAALAEKNLVRVVRLPDGSVRYTMLETIHDFALHELEAAGELAELRARHIAYFLAFVEHGASERMGPLWYDRIEADIENVRAALSAALTSPPGDLVPARMAASLFLFYMQRGQSGEGARWLDVALKHAGDAIDDDLSLLVLEALGSLRGWQARYEEGAAIIDDAIELARALNDEAARVRLIGGHGWIAWINGRHERSEELREALEDLDPAIDPWVRAHALLGVGHLILDAGNFDAAERMLDESVRLFRTLDGDRHGMAHALTKLAIIKRASGDHLAARALALDGIAFARTLNDPHVTAFAADDVVQLAGFEAPPEDVARLLAAADVLRERLAWARTPREDVTRRVEVRGRLEDVLGEQDLAAAEAEGAALSLQEVLDLAERVVETVSGAGKPRGGGARAGDDGLLSRREAEVLALLAEGLSNKDIGERLVLSVRTVEKHVANIYAKIGARGRADAAAYAVRHGIGASD